MSKTLRARGIDWTVVSVGMLLLMIIAGLGVTFYIRGKALMEGELRTRLATMAALAAQQLDAETIESIRGPDDIDSPAVAAIVAQLRNIRSASSDVRFAYIMRKTEDPMMLQFVADADSLATVEELDENGNGVVDADEEGSYPGDLYDISDAPKLAEEAFDGPAVDDELTHDQWGTWISGYAPIVNAAGEPVAILGIDMDANHFLYLSQRIISLPALLLLILAGITGATSVMVFLWQRRIDALRRIDEERSGLLRLAFHNMGQPLTMLKWANELLRESAKHPKHADVVQHLESETDAIARLDGIFHALQDADKVHEGKMDYIATSTPFTSVVDTAVDRVRLSLKHRKQEVDVSVPRNLQLPIDPLLITGVVQELVQNASDFSPEGSVIEVRAQLTQKDTVEISIRDYGIGVPGKELDRIAQEFVRASNASKQKPDGTGLGLYIAKGIIERAGGTFTFLSEEGKGTTVLFTLPLGD